MDAWPTALGQGRNGCRFNGCIGCNPAKFLRFWKGLIGLEKSHYLRRNEGRMQEIIALTSVIGKMLEFIIKGENHKTI